MKIYRKQAFTKKFQLITRQFVDIYSNLTADLHYGFFYSNSSSVFYLRTVNTITNTMRRREYNNGTREEETNRLTHGMQVGEKELKNKKSGHGCD